MVQVPEKSGELCALRASEVRPAMHAHMKSLDIQSLHLTSPNLKCRHWPPFLLRNKLSQLVRLDHFLLEQSPRDGFEQRSAFGDQLPGTDVSVVQDAPDLDVDALGGLLAVRPALG